MHHENRRLRPYVLSRLSYSFGSAKENHDPAPAGSVPMAHGRELPTRAYPRAAPRRRSTASGVEDV